MDTRSIILGNHIFFAREGANFLLPAPGVVGRNAKPAADDDAFVDFGVLKDVGVTQTMQERKIFAATPGRLRLYDTLDTMSELDIKLSLQEMSPLAWEIVFGTQPLAEGANVQYNPLRLPTKKGWIKLQQYRGDDDSQYNTLDLWVKIKVDGEVKFDDNIVAPNITVSVLHSDLNTGVLN